MRAEGDLEEYSRIWDNDNGAYAEFFDGKYNTLLQQRAFRSTLRDKFARIKCALFPRETRIYHANRVVKVLP